MTLTDLGLIFADTMTQSCQRVHPEVDISRWEEGSYWDVSKYSEDALSMGEQQRAKALEAILLYDGLVSARESRKDLHN